MPANAVRGGADSETPYRRPDRSCRSCAGSGARAAGQGHRAGLPALPLAGWLAASGDAATDPARPRTAERELDGGGRAYGAGGGSRRYAGTRLADSRQRRYAGCGLRGLFPVRGRGRTGATAGALSRRAQAARAASQAVPRAGVDVRAASRAAGVETPGVAAAARSSPRSGEPMMEAPEAVSMQSEASPPPPRLTSLSHGGGCGCKIAPGLLSEILRTTVRMPVPPELLVGIETADDAAVYRLNDEQALVATTDFFMPIVDDPFDFGRIAATNAISDVYAMGGRPILALALVGMPIDKLPVAVIGRILQGGESICAEAGIPIAGGHTIDSVEPIYGLVVLGLTHPAKVKKNSGAGAGDVLILGKPLGVGVLSAAVKKNKIDANGYRELIANTTKLNTPGRLLADLPEVHALTDVTGFGLLGHLLGLCRG